jgi:hypothetical protein
MTQDGIGRFVSYHDYAMKDEECERLRARVAELEAAIAKWEAVAVPLDALVCVGRAQFPQRRGNAGLSWYVADALGNAGKFKSGVPYNNELLFVIPAHSKRAASQQAKEEK